MRPVAAGLYSDDELPCLIGGKDRLSGDIVFPLPTGPEASRYDSISLKRRGRVWSYTMQRFRPKSPPYEGPADFSPYIVAYVELPGQITVIARLVDVSLEDVRIGMWVELCFVPLHPVSADSVFIHGFRACTAEST